MNRKAGRAGRDSGSFGVGEAGLVEAGAGCWAVDTLLVEVFWVGGGVDLVLEDDSQASAGESRGAPRSNREASSEVFMERVSLATRVPWRLANRKRLNFKG